jgi:hypothetical protein
MVASATARETRTHAEAFMFDLLIMWIHAANDSKRNGRTARGVYGIGSIHLG